MDNRNRTWAAILFCVMSTSCAPFRTQSFHIVPQSPNYLLRTPDSLEIPFPDLLRTYNGYQPGRNGMDLRRLMELRIENAYYHPGASRQGIEGFLGTEVAQYEVTNHGLHLLAFQPMRERPVRDLPVQSLISHIQASYRYHRLYFEVFFKARSNSRSSALLGANSLQGLDRLSAGLAHPETVGNRESDECTVFPEGCSVSVEMKLFVNGKPRTVLWRSILSDLIQGQPQQVEMERLYAGRLTPVHINPQDSNELKLPLLPGDRVSWK